MSQWQPIETAPKEQVILVYGAKRLEFAVARFTEGDGWESEGTSDWHSMYKPTHWMPLPTPPSGTP